jgi:hypothetical protein
LYGGRLPSKSARPASDNVFSIDAGQMDQDFMLIIVNDAPRIARIRVAAFKMPIVGTPASRPEVVNFRHAPSRSSRPGLEQVLTSNPTDKVIVGCFFVAFTSSLVQHLISRTAGSAASALAIPSAVAGRLRDALSRTYPCIVNVPERRR